MFPVSGDDAYNADIFVRYSIFFLRSATLRYKIVFFNNLKRRVAKLRAFPLRQKPTTVPVAVQLLRYRKPIATIASDYYRIAPAWEEILQGREFIPPRPSPALYGSQQRYAVPSEARENFVAVEYSQRQELLPQQYGDRLSNGTFHELG